MKDITIYSSNEDWFMPIASAPGEFQIHLTAQPSVTGGTDCVLISQQYAGNQISSAIAQLKELHIPCAVVTYDDRYITERYLDEFEADRAAFLRSLRDFGAVIDESVPVSTEGHIITLSTCIGGMPNNRLLIVAAENEEPDS